MREMIGQSVRAAALTAAFMASNGEQATASAESNHTPASVSQLASAIMKNSASYVDGNSVLLTQKLPGQQELTAQIDYERIKPGSRPDPKQFNSLYLYVDRPHPCKPSVPVSIVDITFDASERAGQEHARRETTIGAHGDIRTRHEGVVDGEWSERFYTSDMTGNISRRTESYRVSEARRLLKAFRSQGESLLSGHAAVMPKSLKADWEQMRCDDARRHRVLPVDAGELPSDSEAKPRTTTTAQLARTILAEKPKPSMAPNTVNIEKRLPEGQSAVISLGFSEKPKQGKYDPKKVSYINFLVKKKVGNKEIGPYREISLNKTTEGNWIGHSAYTKVADEVTHITEVNGSKVTTFEQVPVGDSFRNENTRTRDNGRIATKLLGFFKNQAADMAQYIFKGKALPEPK